MLIFAAEKSVSTLCKQHNVNYVTVAVSGGFFIAFLHNQMHIFHTPAVFVFGRDDINACGFDA